jgi:hypothetical protein
MASDTSILDLITMSQEWIDNCGYYQQPLDWNDTCGLHTIPDVQPEYINVRPLPNGISISSFILII